MTDHADLFVSQYFIFHTIALVGVFTPLGSWLFSINRDKEPSWSCLSIQNDRLIAATYHLDCFQPGRLLFPLSPAIFIPPMWAIPQQLSHNKQVFQRCLCCWVLPQGMGGMCCLLARYVADAQLHHYVIESVKDWQREEDVWRPTS